MNRILLVLGSETVNEAAIARLGELAADASAIELLTIVHEPNLDGYLGNSEIYEPLRKRLLDEKSAIADAIAGGLAERGIRATAKAVWDWPRGDAIRREALEFGADCIILSFGLGRDRHIGARDWRFLEACSVPVLVINRPADAPYRHVVAAVDPVHAHAKPEDLDQGIVQAASAVSERSGAALSLVHAFLPLAHFGARADGRERVPLRDAEDALEVSRKAALDRLAAEVGLDPAGTRLIEGKPAAVLESLVDKGEADLIVMGALARGRLAELIIGSTADRLLHRVDCDILLIKPS